MSIAGNSINYSDKGLVLGMNPADLILTAAFRHVISEANIEAGYERFRRLTDDALYQASFCDAIAACLRDGFIREPVRLPEGMLQCHWHLELTPKGVEAAREILQLQRPSSGPQG